MKKTLIVLTFISVMLTGCASTLPAADPAPSTKKAEEITVADTDDNEEAVTDTDDKEEVVDNSADKEETEEPEKATEEVAESAPETGDAARPKAIVWLGDSLTQGSLGDEDDNLANAPYVRLSRKTDIPVEGYGFYGHNTHDIFWMYKDEKHCNQEIDPDKVYIFWVGSCDWCPDEGPNANTAPVIAQIDEFLSQYGGVKNYIVIGTTSRWRLGDLYVPINKDLAAHYGVHYMDCIDIINKYGYSEDNTHLSQASYDSIADAVYDKLKALGYI